MSDEKYINPCESKQTISEPKNHVSTSKLTDLDPLEIEVHSNLRDIDLMDYVMRALM